MSESFDVIVIGAGASGLLAAWELVQTGKRVAVVEAKDHVGGRAHTILDDRFDLPVELGAEFVHGDLDITIDLLKKAGVKHYKLKGDIWQNEDGALDEQSDFIEDYSALNKKFKELKEDVSVDSFIKEHLQEAKFKELRFTLKNYVEGYYAAETTRASTFSLKEELETADDEQYRIEGGYVTIINYLYEHCRERGVQFFLSQIAQKIVWEKDKVEVESNQQNFTAQKLLITVAVGVLQSGKIEFTPAIDDKMEAAKKLGYGPVVKTILQFDEAFWKNKEHTQGKNLSKLSFIFSKEKIPTWWTYYPKDSAMITGWNGGPHSKEIENLSANEILQKALNSLSKIFSTDQIVLEKKLKAFHISKWSEDAFSCGAYSYHVVDGKKFQQALKQSVEDTIFFAGEGLHEGIEIGTVEAAFITGRETAHQIVASFKK